MDERDRVIFATKAVCFKITVETVIAKNNVAFHTILSRTMHLTVNRNNAILIGNK